MKFKKVKQVEPIKESFSQNKIDAVKRSYRQKMGLTENDPIIKEDFKDYALEEVAMRQHLTKDDVIECLLGESVISEAVSEFDTDDTISNTVLKEAQDDATDVEIERENKKWADEINAAVQLDQDNDKSTMEKVLDATYKKNIMNRAMGSTRYVNLLFEGAQGTGKTAVIEQWAAKNGINLVDVKTSALDESDIGVTIVDRETNLPNKVTTQMFKSLENPKSVLFLDEYNRGRPTVRTTLFSLINEHKIPDASQPGNNRYFPNLVFTIAAINPFDADYQTYQLDPAERGRFLKYVVQVEIPSLRAYLDRTFDYQLSQAKQKAIDGMVPTEDPNISIPLEAVEGIVNGRKSLAKALLSHKLSPEIFDTQEEASSAAAKNDISSTSRTLEAALMSCNGTKDSFMYEWEHASNPAKVDVVEKILRQYHDVDDKANSAIGVGGKKKSAFDDDDLLGKVDDFLDSLN